MHNWPTYIQRALAYLNPPENLTVAQWAERYRVLERKGAAAPGKWRNSKTPYLVGVMNAFNDPSIEEIYMCSSAQIGKTEVLLNILGHIIMQDPAPVLMVYPTKELGDSISKNRIMPFIMATKELKERYNFNTSEIRELQFDGMYVSIVGSNAPHALASKPIKVVLLDEVDKFPGATAKEADPISLARERTATYPSYKLYMGSTPTDKHGAIWKALQGADAERHYFVPCPHCGRMIELKFAQLRWPDKESGLTPQERAEQAAYVCQECGAMIYDRDKPGMLEAGEWRDVERRAPVVKRVGFWINRLYSPFTSFAKIAREFMRCHKDTDQLHNFTNSWLAEPWEDKNLSTSAELVMDRRTDLPEFVVPDWAEMLTAGVDVQRASLYWTIRAWGPYETSQNIAHGQVLGWSDIERIMSREYYRQDGSRLLVEQCFIDSGYMADDTYAFCLQHSDWATAVKGASNPMRDHYVVRHVNRAQNIPLVIVDGGRYKDFIAARMRLANGDGSWMVHQGCDEEYAQQVTAEHKVNVKIGKRTEARWQLKHSHADNHYLDCEVYALAAADVLGVRELTVEAPKEPPHPPTAKPVGSSPGNSWLGDLRGRWL